jgi:predicted ATP-dependent serine protease
LNQKEIVRLSQPLFTINIGTVNQIFPGFKLGDFAVLHGSSYIQSLTSLLSVRAQLPPQLGGLASNVIYVDGGNSFNFYEISELAKIHQLNPTKTLNNIYVSRAFTAHQEISLITHHLKKTIETYKAKLIIVSDIAGLFLDKDIPDDEAQKIFNQTTKYLSKFAKENHIIIIATYPPHINTKRNNLLHTLTCTTANITLSLNMTKHAREIILEKHPHLPSGIAKLPSDNLTLTSFIEANA